jgi:hypothetical protein
MSGLFKQFKTWDLVVLGFATVLTGVNISLHVQTQERLKRSNDIREAYLRYERMNKGMSKDADD